jgi:hypothetical protein
MNNFIEIYCLNKQHSDVVCQFLNDLQAIIDDATYYDEDLMGFKEVIRDFIIYHNGLAVLAEEGEVDDHKWYYSLANNVYWATKGYFAGLEDKKSAIIYEKKVISLIQKFLERIEMALIIDPFNNYESRINLN